MDGAREEPWRTIEALHAASFAWARACAADPADAEDVLQAAYEKILTGKARFLGRSSLKTWLFGVIRLTALEHRRRAWLRLLRLAPLEREPAAPAEAPSDDSRRIPPCPGRAARAAAAGRAPRLLRGPHGGGGRRDHGRVGGDGARALRSRQEAPAELLGGETP
ncbi:MAG: hypothetical protein M5U28_35700 [Sandaracinaceae bacterium]|nr:hypothetical protein [Sandaracinaceae bacterium]